MGLREDKKQRLRAEIIANAVAMFREFGFEAVRVQQIAARTRISEATFFNYFPSKELVLSEWVHGCVDEAFAIEASSSGDRGLRRSIREVARRVARWVEEDASFRRCAWQRVRLARSTPNAAAPTGEDAAKHPAAQRLVERGRERGEVRGDLPAEQLAELLVATLMATVGGWLATASATRGGDGAGGLEPRLQGALDLLLDGFRKRHERVRSVSARVTHAAPSS